MATGTSPPARKAAARRWFLRARLVQSRRRSPQTPRPRSSAVALRFEVCAPVPEVIAAYPDATFSGGGASVEVTVAKGRGFEDEDIPTVCRFGIEATPATFVSAWEACASGARATRPPVDAEAYLAQRRRLGECVGYATVRSSRRRTPPVGRGSA